MLPSQIYQDERHAGKAIEYLIGQFNLDASPTTQCVRLQGSTGRLTVIRTCRLTSVLELCHS